jgi:hypothetical protein
MWTFGLLFRLPSFRRTLLVAPSPKGGQVQLRHSLYTSEFTESQRQIFRISLPDGFSGDDGSIGDDDTYPSHHLTNILNNNGEAIWL